MKRSLSPFQANFALAVFLLAYVLSFVDRQIISLLVDPIRRDLGASDVQMGLLQGMAFSLLYGVLGVPLGLLADRAPRKYVITGGVLFWSFATGLCGAAGSYAALFAARMGVGVGEAALSPSVHSHLSDAFPPAKLARAMAIYSAGITLGGGLAFLIGGAVVSAVADARAVSLPLIGAVRPWQAAYAVVAAPGLLVAALAALVREPPRTARPAGVRRASLADCVRYVASNRRAFAAVYLPSSFLGVLGYGLSAWYPTLLMRGHGLTAAQAGLWVGGIYLVLGSAGSVAGGLVSERLARRGRRDANLVVVAGAAAGVLAPALVAALAGETWLALTAFAIAAFIFNSFFGCSTAALQLATPGPMRATNAALFLLCNNLIGLTLGALGAPLLNAVLFGATKDLGRPMALIAALVCPLAAALSWWGRATYAELVATVSESRP